MAKFNGTIQDFEKFVGPRLRNIVQTSIARKYKKNIAKCQFDDCSNLENLEAAHIHGNDRKSLIKKSLAENIVDDKIVDLDLNLFEQKFVKLHYPLEKSFLILCKECHRKYDNITESIIIENVIENIDENNLLIEEEQDSKFPRMTLDIELIPNDTLEFKELLLKYKSAYMSIFYNDGTKEIKEWNASNMSEKSDIIRNLRSRPDFRQGNWQKLNIKRVEVEINY
ncbi:hypothetical protein [Flavobacterium macacae]|uniref:Uncharacterized protein n=1 Tax=Flavobacterium macacae TaxID=2488993 RepID=A0A3P3VWI1_9FLAO|nr:hypothetical protein [Flavobacterium macacae]RRJ87151.1 hypothetical protein EG849_15405 [Flavobacterium macacae]